MTSFKKCLTLVNSCIIIVEPLIMGLMAKWKKFPPNSSETNIKAGARKCTQLSKPAASSTV